MIRAHCPVCSRAVEAIDLSGLPYFPFCSERCRLVDLNRWIEGEYSIPRPATVEDIDEALSLEDEEGTGIVQD